MAYETAIEWTESTWNPVTGCTKISSGCAHCYAERMARRLQAMGAANYSRGFEVALHEEVLATDEDRADTSLGREYMDGRDRIKGLYTPREWAHNISRVKDGERSR